MDWKRLGKKLLFPPFWLMIVLTFISAVALIFVFVKNLQEEPISYAVYILSFYTLSIVCVFISMVLPKKYKKIKQKIYDNPFGNQYMTDMAFRTHISLYGSLGVNLLYVGVNILSFLFYRSMWFVVLAGYYSILAIMRFLLVWYVRKSGIGKNRLGELKSTALCSVILLTVNFVLSGAVLMILYQDKGFQYHGILIYVMAMYTFFVTIQAIKNMIKYRKYNSPIMSMTKVISLTAALVSMLSLETAMFSQFGQDMSLENKQIMIILTGAGVSMTVVTMALYMIIKTSREIKEYGDNSESL